jgi:hypothetical protein
MVGVSFWFVLMVSKVLTCPQLSWLFVVLFNVVGKIIHHFFCPVSFFRQFNWNWSYICVMRVCFVWYRAINPRSFFLTLSPRRSPYGDFGVWAKWSLGRGIVVQPLNMVRIHGNWHCHLHASGVCSRARRRSQMHAKFSSFWRKSALMSFKTQTKKK